MRAVRIPNNNINNDSAPIHKAMTCQRNETRQAALPLHTAPSRHAIRNACDHSWLWFHLHRGQPNHAVRACAVVLRQLSAVIMMELLRNSEMTRDLRD